MEVEVELSIGIVVGKLGSELQEQRGFADPAGSEDAEEKSTVTARQAGGLDPGELRLSAGEVCWRSRDLPDGGELLHRLGLRLFALKDLQNLVCDRRQLCIDTVSPECREGFAVERTHLERREPGDSIEKTAPGKNRYDRHSFADPPIQEYRHLLSANEFGDQEVCGNHQHGNLCRRHGSADLLVPFG